MRRLSILLFLFSSLALPQSFAQSEGDESKIIALENLWNQMQVAHDADAMDKMLHADFVLTDYDGSVLNNTRFRVSIRDKSNQLTSEVSQDMKLHRPDNTGVVTSATPDKGNANGKPYEDPGHLT